MFVSDKYINSSGLQTIKTWITNMLGNKVSKASSPTTGNFMSFDASGNASDSGKNASDFATKSEANTGKAWFGVCATAAATQEKTVTIEGITELSTGLFILVSFTEAQTYNGAPTLNLNSLGAKNIRRLTETNAARYEWQAGEVLPLVYNGTYWVILDGGTATTTYYGVTKLATSATSTSTSTSLTPASLNSFAQNMISGEEVYSASATYAVGDRVRYGYCTYECITAITTAEAWTAAHWKALDPLQTQIENIDNIYIATCTTNPSSSDVATLHAEIWSATSLGKTVFLKYNNHIYTLATIPASSSDDILFFRATAATIGASTYPVNERIQVTTTTISTSIYIGGTFIAVYGSTTRSQLLNAYNNGLNIVLMYDDPNNANYHYIAPLSRAIIGSGSNSWRFTCVTETTLYDFFLNTSSVWSITTRAIATEAYVDDICGDIETALSTINTALGGMV